MVLSLCLEESRQPSDDKITDEQADGNGSINVSTSLQLHIIFSSRHIFSTQLMNGVQAMVHIHPIPPQAHKNHDGQHQPQKGIRQQNYQELRWILHQEIQHGLQLLIGKAGAVLFNADLNHQVLQQRECKSNVTISIPNIKRKHQGSNDRAPHLYCFR